MAYPYLGSVNLGASKAAATITASVVDLTGAALGTQPTRTVRNLGGGAFGISIPDMPDGQTGWVLIQESGTTLAVLTVNPHEVENTDAKVSGRLAPAVAGRALAVDTAGAVDVATVGGSAASVLTSPITVNLTQLLGQAIPTPRVAGVPIVDIGYANGVGPVTLDPTIAVTLASGTVATGTSTTSFTATISGSTLSSASGAYVGEQKVLFQSGVLATQGRPVTGYTVSGGIATITVSPAFPVAPGAGDTFVIG